jgi:uncharacterized protein YukE
MSEQGAATAQRLDYFGQGSNDYFANLYQTVQHIDDNVPRKAAQDLRTSAQSAKGHAEEVQSAVSSLSSAWTGTSSDEFAATAKKFLTAHTSVQESLDFTAKNLDGVANTIKKLHDDVDGVLRDAETQADAAQKEGEKNRAKADTIQQTNQAKSAADAQIGKIKDDASAAVHRLVQIAEGDISGYLGDLHVDLDGDGFTGLRPIGSVDTTPASAGSPVGPLPGGGPSLGHNHGGGSSPGVFGLVPRGAGMGPSGAPPATLPPGNVDQWIREAIKILQDNGVPVTDADIQKIWTIIQHESGGNPNAINNWDSNAAAGHPSKGLMQCIDSTFNSNKLPGHDNIYNPVDNIIAGVQYTFKRYGGFAGHPGLQAMAHGGGYQGY